MIATCFVQPGHQMRASWTGRPGAHGKPTGKFGLARSGEGGAFFMTHSHPVDVAAPNGIRDAG